MRNAAQAALTVAVVAFAARALLAQWRSVAGQPLPPVAWGWLLASCAVVLATYALLIETWRRVLMLWRAPVPFAEAARIWSISNLGKYVPGKVWQLGAMTVMLRRSGVSLGVAAGAAAVVTLGNLVAGFALVFGLGGRSVAGALGPAGARVAAVAVALGAFGLLAAPLLVRRVARWIAERRGGAEAPPPVPAAAAALATAGCAVAWVLYGVAFQCFALALLGRPAYDPLRWTVAYALSYLLGYLALFAPGGLGVRELALVGVLGTLGLAGQREAVVLALGSRLWLTVLELVPGLAFLAVDRMRARRVANSAAGPR